MTCHLKVTVNHYFGGRLVAGILSLKFASYFSGGAGALARAEPLVRLSKALEKGSRRGRRPQSRGTAPRPDLFNELQGQETSRMLKKAFGDRLPRGRGSVNTCKHALAILSRAREQAGFCLFQHPASE
jgi:hypothetical protein